MQHPKDVFCSNAEAVHASCTQRVMGPWRREKPAKEGGSKSVHDLTQH